MKPQSHSTKHIEPDLGVVDIRQGNMKKTVVSPACWQPARDHRLQSILRRCGAYYHSAALFYHELWKQRLVNIGFRVLRIEKLPYHNVWDVKVYRGLAAQTICWSVIRFRPNLPGPMIRYRNFFRRRFDGSPKNWVVRSRGTASAWHAPAHISGQVSFGRSVNLAHYSSRKRKWMRCHC
jgi:hypothetical protein